jgi:hypothetical protein
LLMASVFLLPTHFWRVHFPSPGRGDAAISHPYVRPDSWPTGQTRLITRNLFQQEFA